MNFELTTEQVEQFAKMTKALKELEKAWRTLPDIGAIFNSLPLPSIR